MTIKRHVLEKVVIHFAGDSGDGMQVVGMQLTHASASLGNDVQTLPDFPAEIRAPAGTLAGVSGFQLSFSDHDIHTPGDQYDVLVAMNPAALKAALPRLRQGGILIVDEDKFQAKELKKVGLEDNPLTSEALQNYRLIVLPMTTLTLKATEGQALTRPKARKCKNMFALGVMYWLYDRPYDATYDWIGKRYQKELVVAEANQAAFKAGYDYAITAEVFNEFYTVKPADFPSGHYKQITGNMAVSLGSIAAACVAKTPLFVAGYPITPASDILHHIAAIQAPSVTTFQAEDEISAIGAAIGAAFGGHLALTTTSGPGMDLKMESMGLAVMAELPLVIVDVQRAGPSTGMPTKVEQSDLLMAIYGRHGECPMPVLAPNSPGDCFNTMLEAFRIAVESMTPVIVLCDAYLANSAEPWQIPSVAHLSSIPVQFKTEAADFLPYSRDETTLARAWVKPGTPDLMHRIGGLEKQVETGNISYDPNNHQEMVDLRQAKIDRLAETATLETFGDLNSDCVLISWGSTRGVVRTVVDNLKAAGIEVAMIHLRQLYPLPKALKALLETFKKVFVIELNKGQLLQLIRSTFLVDAKGIHKITGQPFFVSELQSRIMSEMGIQATSPIQKIVIQKYQPDHAEQAGKA